VRTQDPSRHARGRRGICGYQNWRRTDVETCDAAKVYFPSHTTKSNPASKASATTVARSMAKPSHGDHDSKSVIAGNYEWVYVRGGILVEAWPYFSRSCRSIRNQEKHDIGTP
jgi:hypothetical protein